MPQLSRYLKTDSSVPVGKRYGTAVRCPKGGLRGTVYIGSCTPADGWHLNNTGSTISQYPGHLWRRRTVKISKLSQCLYIVDSQILILASVCSASSCPPSRARVSLVQPATTTCHHRRLTKSRVAGDRIQELGLIKYRVHARSWPLPRSCPEQGPAEHRYHLITKQSG